MNWLLDTNVILETSKLKPSADVSRWLESQPLNSFYTMSLAFAEIRSGIERMPESPRKSEFMAWLEHKVRPLFGMRILEPDEDFWMTMFEVMARAKSKGRTLPVADLLFAAAAERHGFVLVTRNVKHFDGAGIRVLDPWQPRPKIRGMT